MCRAKNNAHYILMLNPIKKKRFIIPNLKVEALKAKDGKYLSTVTQFVKDKISFLHRLVIPKFISISTSYTKVFLREAYFKRKQSTN